MLCFNYVKLTIALSLLFPEAAEDAAEALVLNPKNAKAWLRKGYCFNVVSVFIT